MNCRQVKTKLTSFLLGDLTPQSGAAIKTHLEKCMVCRAYAREIEPTLDLLRDALAATSAAPASLSEEHRDNIAEAMSPRPGLRRSAARPARKRLRITRPGETRKTPGVIEWITTPRVSLGLAAAAALMITALGGLMLMPMSTESPRSAEKAVLQTTTQAPPPPPMSEMDEMEEITGERRMRSESRPMAASAINLNGDVTTDRLPFGAGTDVSGMSGEIREADAFGYTLPPADRPMSRMKAMMKSALEAPEPADIMPELAEELKSFEDFRRSLKENGKPLSPTPAKFDSVAMVKSPVIMKGIYQSRSPGARGRAVTAYGGAAGTGKDDLETTVSNDRADPAEEVLEEDSRFDKDGESRTSISQPGPPPAPGKLLADVDDEPTRRGLVRKSRPVSTETLESNERETAARQTPEYSEKKEKGKAEDEEESGPRFRASGVNPFVMTSANPFSTFAIDVDTASYTLARNYMVRGKLPPAEAVRTEEFVNFFDYAYKPPATDTFKVYADCAPSKFGRGLYLFKIGVKGKRIGREEQKNAVLTLVIDGSGSMNTPDRIGLVRKSVAMLLENLAPGDRVAIVQFGSRARLVLDYTPASEKETIMKALNAIQPTGSTNLEDAMNIAYELAGGAFDGAAVNRVLIMSDGAANLGAGAAEEILSKVAGYREHGIYCSVFGFGIGTYNDEMLETLANKGDGTYSFVDSEDEAQRLFVNELGATLNTIASDVKIQVEFNPEIVRRYRQIGYENRALTKEQFRDDTVDAGEVGSGQSVTALYELELSATETKGSSGSQAIVGTVRVRYRRSDNGAIEEISRPFRLSEITGSFEETGARFRLSAAVAEFAEILRASPYAAGSAFGDVSQVLDPVALELNLDRRVGQLRRMTAAAGGMSRGDIQE